MPRRSGRLSKGPGSDGLSVKKLVELHDGHKKKSKFVYDHKALRKLWTDFCNGTLVKPDGSEGGNVFQFIQTSAGTEFFANYPNRPEQGRLWRKRVKDLLLNAFPAETFKTV